LCDVIVIKCFFWFCSIVCGCFGWVDLGLLLGWLLGLVPLGSWVFWLCGGFFLFVFNLYAMLLVSVLLMFWSRCGLVSGVWWGWSVPVSSCRSCVLWGRGMCVCSGLSFTLCLFLLGLLYGPCATADRAHVLLSLGGLWAWGLFAWFVFPEAVCGVWAHLGSMVPAVRGCVLSGEVRGGAVLCVDL
jgi:hypothetical protein